MAPLKAFAYGGVSLQESVMIGQQPYFTARAIGEWLEYEHPVQSVNNLISRNPHIQDSEWSVVTKLVTTDGKSYDTRVYNPIGLQLILFESRQPKAIEYKIAVAKLVNDMATGKFFFNYVNAYLDSIEPWVPKSKRRKRK